MNSALRNQPKKRLASLDILRGFDLFLLVALQHILMTIGQLWDNPTYHTFLHQFDHEVWEGFRLWDLVMPLFDGDNKVYAVTEVLSANKDLYLAILKLDVGNDGYL